MGVQKMGVFVLDNGCTKMGVLDNGCTKNGCIR